MSDISTGQFSQLASAVVSSLWPAVKDADGSLAQKWIEDRAGLTGALQDALFPPGDLAELLEVKYGDAVPESCFFDYLSAIEGKIPRRLECKRKRIGTVKVTIHFVYLRRGMQVNEVLETLYRMHLRPGDLWELTAVVRKTYGSEWYCDAVRKGLPRYLVALDSVFTNKNGIRVVPAWAGHSLTAVDYDQVWGETSSDYSIVAVGE